MTWAGLRARRQSLVTDGKLLCYTHSSPCRLGPREPRTGAPLTMSKQEEAGLILKLYELRREDTMRKARDWYFREFNPQSMADFDTAILGEHSGHLRMVLTYWDMAAALVNNGAISPELFDDSNGEHIGVFAKCELLLGEIRSAYGPK